VIIRIFFPLHNWCNMIMTKNTEAAGFLKKEACPVGVLHFTSSLERSLLSILGKIKESGVDNQLWSFFPPPLTCHISFSVCLVFVAVDPLWHCITGSPIYKHAISLFIFLLVASVLGFIYAAILISCTSFEESLNCMLLG
jgi:hypothetical protein